MTARSTRWLVFALAAIVMATGCGGVIDPSKNTVREFPGVLVTFGLGIHEFDVSRNGEFDVKITALSSPDATLLLSYGQHAGGCNGSALLGSAYRQLNQIGFGGLISPGRYCIYLSDEFGQVRGTSSYTLRVSHP
jgi:hypothetical protein